MTIHFVYACWPGPGMFGRRRGHAVRVAQRLGVPLSFVGERTRVDTSRWPANAPLSITHHLLQGLRTLAPVRLYDWKERVSIRPEPGDVLVGHPLPGEPDSVFSRALRAGGFAATLALVPLHYGLSDIVAAVAPELDACDHILGIMGPYWFDTWRQGPFAHWTAKLTHVDMAIDVTRFPRVKRRFHAKGRRKFLFIGNGLPYKGAHLLSLLFTRAAGRHACVWVGADRELPALERRPRLNLQGEAVERLAEECDVFLTLGTSDANPTTILEAMAWGFPVACSPQSGYYDMEEFRTLSTVDMDHNLAVLEAFQQAEESELLAVADRARRRVEADYTFERMVATVVGEVRRFLPQPGGAPPAHPR